MEAHPQNLPEELLSAVFGLLSRSDQLSVAGVCKAFHEASTPLIYQTVNFVDRCLSNGDDHDDSLIIRLLYTLASKPHLARHVRKVTHSCHLPVPNIFGELPRISLQGPIRAHSLQTLKLLQIAILRMTHVHTLQIIFGHFSFTTGLIRGFFNPARQYQIPVQRLWVETTCLEGIRTSANDLSMDAGGLSFAELRSCRFRRLRFLAEEEISRISGHRDEWRILTRGGPKSLFKLRGENIDTSSERFIEHSTEASNDEQDIWNSEVNLIHPKLKDFVQDHAPEWSWINMEASIEMHHYQSPETLLVTVFKSSANSLTSLNLDWIIGIDGHFNTIWSAMPTFPHLKALQLRNLLTQETQILKEDVLLMEPDQVFFQFLQRHPQIQCLSWPLQHFFAQGQNAMIREHDEVRDLTSHLGRRLKTLRVDFTLAYIGETKTDDSTIPWAQDLRRGRYRFVEHFAAHMEAVELVKIEGGIPKDETREILRALRRCPVEKVVIIGTSWPLGDLDHSDSERNYQASSSGSVVESLSEITLENGPPTFGITHSMPHGVTPEVQTSLAESVFSSQDAVGPKAASRATFPALTPIPPTDQDYFVPSFGRYGPSVLNVLASQFSSTIKALKFCGYHGAPELWTVFHEVELRDILAPLAQFRRLHSLYIAIDLDCIYEGQDFGLEVEQFWKDEKSKADSLKARVSVSRNGKEEGEGGEEEREQAHDEDEDEWTDEEELDEEEESSDDDDYDDNEWTGSRLDYLREADVQRRFLKERFAPKKMARRIMDIIGIHLSPLREQNTEIRALLWKGDSGRDGQIFELGVIVSPKAKIVDVWGPRGEFDPEKVSEKQSNRAWY